MNKTDQNSLDPILQLEKCLLRINDDFKRLEAYREFLPDIVSIRPAEALHLASKAIMIALSIRDLSGQVEFLRYRAEAELNLRNPATALADLRDAKDLAEESNDIPSLVRISISIAEAYRQLGEPVIALDWYEKGLAGCEPGATIIRADALDALADFYLSVGRYDEAIGLLRESLAIREELGDQAGIGRGLCAIGTGYGKMEDLAMAYEFHERSLEAFEKAGDTKNLIRTLANMAAIQKSRGEFNAALATAWRAHAACDEKIDPTASASLIITIAGLHQQQGELDLALKHYVKAYDLLQKHPADDLLLGLYLHVGNIHKATDDLDAARHVYNHALQIAEKLQERQSQMELHRAISGVFERQGLYREALLHYQQFATLQHNLAGEEQRRKIAEVQTKYDLMEVKRERDEAWKLVNQLEEDKELQHRELLRARIDLAEKSIKQEKATTRKKRPRGSTIQDRNRNGRERTEASSARTWKKKNVSQRSPSDADREWEKLRLDLEKIHPDLERILFERCPELTPTEMKICLLTKLLGDDTARIADVLDNTLRTVQTQRLKIRKKLGLPGEIHFATYIQTL